MGVHAGEANSRYPAILPFQDNKRNWPPTDPFGVHVNALYVRLRALRFGYARGETARIETHVAHLSSLQHPVAGALVFVGVSIGASFSYCRASTGADGRALVAIALPVWTPRRAVAVDAYALQTLASGNGTVVIHEYGFVRSEGTFQILDRA